MSQIWIVEDDEDIREIVSYTLSAAGFEACCFESAADFYPALEKRTQDKEALLPALILLDIMLPGDDGLTILKKLRQNTLYQTLPIIMLTAKSYELDKVKGLDLGADDYLTKPFSVLELVSRIKALLRRSKLPVTSHPEIGYQNIQLDHERREVLVDGVATALTFKEYELLHYLLINPGMVLSRDRILESVWGYDYEGESRTLDAHIKSLRQKLGAAGEHIKTIRSVGYKLGE